MKLNKKDNILKNLWFNLIAIPGATFFFIMVEQLAKGFEEADKLIMTYLAIGVITLAAQTFIYFQKSVKHISLHYLYIILSINVSLFIGYVLGKFIIPNEEWWQKWLINPLLVFVILFGIKSVLWIITDLFYRKRVNKEVKDNNLEKENIRLKQELEQMKRAQAEDIEKNAFIDE